jgi:tRNA-specific 2-thiouridylase
MIKFGELLRLADEIGADFLATGHYARIKREFPISNFQFPNAKLYKSKDNTKDQSYFLYTLTQDQLGRVLFPLGDKLKTDVKKIAKKAGLPHLKRESQDVCFLNQEGKIIEHNEFLRARIKPRPGKIIDLNSGKVLGKHQGLPFYTLGQRRGVEIGGTGPYYVARKDTKANTLFVVNKFDDPAIYSRELTLGDVNWISGQAPKLPLKCEAVIRYRHEQVKCEVRSKKLEVRSKKSEEYVVRFYQPQRAVTPGQSVVFYSKDEVLGGGVIAGS